MLTALDPTRIEELLGEATRSPRRRSHVLLHAGPDDQVQRLLIACCPDTYVRPHKHSQQWEMLLVLEGRLDLLLLDEAGHALERRVLTRTAPVVQIPAGVWHACVVQAERTLVLEVKPGPYRANEFAPWAPPEGSAEAVPLVSAMRAARSGDCLQSIPSPGENNG